jgi:hypothetical protein
MFQQKKFYIILKGFLRKVVGEQDQQLTASKTKLERIKPVIGVFDDRTVKLDFDGKPFKIVKYWAGRTCKNFKLEGYRILKSSEGNYHVIFNRSVSWTENMQIMSLVSLLIEGKQLKNCPLTKYVLMCGIKTVSCLRIGKKREKPSPRTVFKFGKQNNEIKNYLKFKRNLRCFL